MTNKLGQRKKVAKRDAKMEGTDYLLVVTFLFQQGGQWITKIISRVQVCATISVEGRDILPLNKKGPMESNQPRKSCSSILILISVQQISESYCTTTNERFLICVGSATTGGVQAIARL